MSNERRLGRLTSLLRRRGIVLPSYEIYGGVSGLVDYGPVGARIKRKVIDVWVDHWTSIGNVVEVDSPTITPEPVLVASGHVDEFNDHMNVKVMGYLRCAREVAPLMVEQRWGRIINISGMASRNSGTVVASMRNVAVTAMTKNLAEELAPLGINVTVVHPGMPRTEATEGVITRRAKSTGLSESEVEHQMAEGNSVKTIIDASDIAYVVTMLAAPRSIAINGDVIAAGGGVGTSIYY